MKRFYVFLLIISLFVPCIAEARPLFNASIIETKDVTVYITRTGKKYHISIQKQRSSGCRQLKIAQTHNNSTEIIKRE